MSVEKGSYGRPTDSRLCFAPSVTFPSLAHLLVMHDAEEGVLGLIASKIEYHVPNRRTANEWPDSEARANVK
jgi:hypothetical protein